MMTAKAKDGKDDGWLSGVRRVVSPNWDERPPGVVVDLLVVHGISLPAGCFSTANVNRLFTNRISDSPDFNRMDPEVAALRVSSHFLVDRDGTLTQYVPVHRRAWHAGVSSFAGRDNCNDFSIGVELMGNDDQPYEEAQYQCLADCARRLRHLFPSLRHIAGHCHIAPGRKTDPGPSFDWERCSYLLRG